jgi:pilus assembly protein CpaB
MKMSIRTAVVALLALICGVSAAVFVNQYRSAGLEQAKATATVKIAIARVEIARGTTINEEMIGLREWPKDLVPPGAILTVEDAINNTAMANIIKDEPLLQGKIAEGRGLAPMIPPGMRAYTISASTASANIAGFLMPGNKVDVMLTISGGNEFGGGTTATLLQLVEVLAVEQLLNAPAENKVPKMRSVTLLVSPNQAQKLSLAQSKGTLHLTLRNDTDESPVETNPVSLAEIRLSEEPPLDYVGLAGKFGEGLSRTIGELGKAAIGVAETQLNEMNARAEEELANAELNEPQEPPEEPSLDRYYWLSRGMTRDVVRIMPFRRPPADVETISAPPPAPTDDARG